MSEKLFEAFLVEHLRAWLSGRVKEGDRYQFRSADPDNTVKLLAALQCVRDGVFHDGSFPLSCILIDGIQIIIAGHADGGKVEDGCYTENYLAKLRDDVVIKSAALLMVHNSSLDTITNSTFDLAQSGAAWSLEEIRKKLADLIDDGMHNRVASRCLLNHQFTTIQTDGASIFGFRHLHDSLMDGDLRFDELGLFNDPAVLDYQNEMQAQRRLEENRKLRSEIEFELEHHSNELEERLTQFGSSFIKKHFDENADRPWTELTFDEFTTEIERQKKQELDFDGMESASCNIQSRSKKETTAGLRDKHLMIQAPKENVFFEFELRFSGVRLEENELKIVQPRNCNHVVSVDHRVRGFRTTFRIWGDSASEPIYFTIELNRDLNSERYKFHCMVIREGDFYLRDLYNQFLINRTKQALVLQAEKQVVEVNPDLLETIVLEDSGQLVDINSYGKLDFQQLYDESDEVFFTLKNGLKELNVMVEGESIKESLYLPLMMDPSRTNQLFKDDYFAIYKKSKETVVLDNQESKPPFLRQQLLRAESTIIEDELISWNGDQEKGLEARYLKEMAGFELYDSYLAFLRYFKDGSRRTLPSLAGWGPQLVSLAKAYVSAYLSHLETLEKGKTLGSEAKYVMKLGTATLRDITDAKVKHYLTPFHPLVVSYYLYLIDAILEDDEPSSFRNLATVTRKRLTPRGLIPHLYDSEHGYSYTQTVEENAFWMEIVPREETSFNFVIKLVRHKIEEFTTTFGQLFEQVENAPILINSVNNAENTEIFKGILSYYQEHLEQGRHIHVNLYDEDGEETEFDLFAEMAFYDEIKDRYGLDKGAAKRNADTIVDLLRTRLSFSKFNNASVDSQKYAHLTFFKNNQVIDTRDNNIDDHLSGIACGGLLNGESSRSENGSYFTAFGLKNVDCRDKPHLKIAKLFGKLWRPSKSSNDIYHDHSAISLAVSEQVKLQLERSYESSLWITIIDPKVTLEFFKNTRGLVLIHYSDQYTSSAGYDAITVTKQSQLYQSVLGSRGENLIREFNAFNGEWLLRMISDRDTEKLAKKGVIGAYKVVASMLSKSDICWVPLSVAEMIRVAGNMGLAMSDSDFSRHNLGIKQGAISDDILFAGFKDGKLYLLPVEVKAGSRPDFSKARKQALELRKYMEYMLGQDNLAGKLYRSLFIRQVLLQVEKYQLYEVFEENHFDALLNQRVFWLEGAYELGSLLAYPTALVVAHLNSDWCFTERYEERDGVLEVEIPVSLLDSLVHSPYNELQRKVIEGRLLRVPGEYFLKDGNVACNLTSTSHPEAALEGGSEHTAEDLESTAISIDSEKTPFSEQNQPELVVPLTVQFGTDVQTGQPVLWEPTNTEKLFNTNTGIIGTMGTGKTQFTKSLITQLVRNQHHNVGGAPIGILIFDYKADYVKSDFVTATNAKVFNLFHLPFNPFALFGDRPMQPVHTANLFRTTMSKAFGLGPKQQNRIRSLVMDAYDAAGISPQDRNTWSRSVPTLADIWALFQEQEKVEQDSLYAALDDLMSFEIFEPDASKTQSLYDLIDGVIVINLSGYDTSIQNLVVALTLDLFYTQMHQKGSSKLDGNFRQISKMILVDEADNFMSQNFESLKKILKEGREFGVGTILSTQELTHFKTGENDYSSLILSWVIHQVANIKSQEIKAIFNTQNKQDEDVYMSHIRKLEKHHSLCIDGRKKISKIQDLAFWELV